MTKQEFITALRARLSGLPRQEVEERLAFYSEMIDDRMEEGISEAEAVADVGSVDAIAEQILSDIPLSRIAKERIKPQRSIKTWEIVLLVLGSPIWLSLAIAALAVILSLYVVLWSVVVSLWAVFASLAACAFGGTFAGLALLFWGKGFTGLALLGMGLVCLGLAIFFFFGCKEATKGIVVLTQRIALGIKRSLVRKEKSE